MATNPTALRNAPLRRYRRRIYLSRAVLAAWYRGDTHHGRRRRGVGGVGGVGGAGPRH